MNAPTNLRQRLAQAELLLGTMVTLPAPEVTELLSQVGFDWLFLDAEHAPLDAARLQRLIQAAGATLPCLVRLPTAAEVAVKQALDVGAAGIIAPQVNSAETAAAVVGWARYAPQGNRGVGITRAHGYGARFAEYMATANEATTVVVQIEHSQAVEQIEAIVAVPGIDAALVGPYDLSASMGMPGQVQNPAVQAAIERVTAVCRAADMPMGIFGLDAAAVRPYIDQGYRLIVAGVDTLMLHETAATLLRQLR
ncbi:MAG: aldolase/citrate lyase family protein [Candidatus Promineifilaceae bacterium]|nr:aldolase/citrate lyase family protein [Candidatus Promineifilaceae bacterium]